MVKCSICDSTRNLVYALNPITFLTTYMCDLCYAKNYFPNEYPKLSSETVAHIRNLPKVTSSGTTTNSNSQIPPFLSVNQSPGKTTILLPDSALWNGKLCLTPTCTSDHSDTSNTTPFGGSVKKNKRQSTSDNDDSPTKESKRVKNNNREIQKKALNDFIKQVLFPEKMDIIDCSPPPKGAKFDLDDDETDTEPENKSDWPFEWIGGDVKTIKDLIRIGREYLVKPRKVVTNLDLKKLSNLVEPLETLDKMIGLEDIKASIFKQVVFHLQELDNKNKDMHHTVIKGPPGVGKTQISHIIARIYKGLGFLKNDTVVSVKRDDLIAGYLGQTAMKAKKKYEEALGGVLLIDEAYALGDGSDKDSYSKEAIDLLTSYLSEHGHEFICIIAGYKEALEKRFFSINEGLARRFNIHYDIKPYSGTDVCQIFQKLVTEGEWQLDPSAHNPAFFIEHLADFPHFGGDMQTLFAYTKKAHSTRLLGIRTREELMATKKKINKDDLLTGFELFKLGNGYAGNTEISSNCKFMYS